MPTTRHVPTGVPGPIRCTGSGVRGLKRLTDREKEVLLLLGTGLGNRELAREPGIAERTVKAHIARIVEKLGQRTRLQAAVLSALAHDVLCADPCRCAPARRTASAVPAAVRRLTLNEGPDTGSGTGQAGASGAGPLRTGAAST